MNNARRTLEIRRVSALLCKVTTPVNPNGSSRRRPSASGRSEIETNRLNSSCSKQDHEIIIVESQRLRSAKSKRLTRTTSRTDVKFPCRTTTWCTKPIPTPTTMKILEARTAVDEDWTKLQKQPAWDESNVTNNAVVIQRANFEGKTVHFCNIKGLVSSQEF